MGSLLLKLRYRRVVEAAAVTKIKVTHLKMNKGGCYDISSDGAQIKKNMLKAPGDFNTISEKTKQV